MARVLILREAAEAEKTARELSLAGHQPLMLPLERSVDIDAPLQEALGDAAIAGFALTSARAVPALAGAFPADRRPVLCVGRGTAEAAGAAGFPDVRTARGAASGMGRLAIETGITPGAILLYAAGRRRTGTLERALDAAAIGYRIWEVYDIVPVTLSAGMVRSVLMGGPPDAVLLLSAGQAEGYLRLAQEMPDLFTPQPRLLALSERVAAALPQPWRAATLISREPTLASLFERLG
ncbi:uroporphyrinogen-III synthase [Jiella sonneratiae]|uniref:Uroporphyrinogen-III synthase n=1 Tax=Jiella sonneratiae TaxID=2816856 RepID=A0ABS3J5C7_9HYPH|nr:uroporphyrinogen-III synthase [Jiella sonneratiae]MBO0904881.1 uroporphyrinogen-III synthase [Jiella sonneratiae]